MGKTRDFFKKTGDTKGTFHIKMGTIKDRKQQEEIRKPSSVINANRGKQQNGKD